MRTKDAVSHFGTQVAIAAALGITKSAVSQWGEYPPEDKQLELQRVTRGELKAEKAVIDKYRALLSPSEHRAS